jgi:hypothetical protein
MGRRILRSAAASQAESVIADLEITSLPVDPFAIADKHEITVMKKVSDAPGVSGFLLKQGDAFGIMYATHVSSAGFIRFTVSHELGHYFLPGHPAKLFPAGDGLHCSKSGFICDEECEVEADHFAATLLMPERLFLDAVRTAGAGFPAIEHLADLCETSITATAIRYAELAEDPVAVVMSCGRNVEWCFMSAPLHDLRGLQWLRKGALVPPSSATGRFNRVTSNVRTTARDEAWSSLDLWLDGAPKVDVKEDVVGLGSYGRTLTVLFTEDALEDEEDWENEDD